MHSAAPSHFSMQQLKTDESSVDAPVNQDPLGIFDNFQLLLFAATLAREIDFPEQAVEAPEENP